MDKYEFNIKVEQIKKMSAKGDHETAMKIADTIDWRRVRNANLLSSVAEIYEQNGEYAEAKDILLLAFERAPVGKRLLYKLSEISVEAGDIQDAEDFYREFCEMSPDDSRQYLLRYMILKAKGAPAEQLINSLEQYSSTDVDEKWLYELAVLYSRAAREDDCIRTCDKIMLLFGLGKYVDKAMELKLQYAPLTKQQMDLVENRDKYEEKLREVEKEYSTAEEDYYEEDPVLPALGDSARTNERADESIAYAREKARELVGNVNRESTVITDDVEELDDIEELFEDEEQLPDAYHMIIEAKTREEGLNIAIDELKYFHEELGVENKVAKTNAEKLNQKGFSGFVPRLAGKDLIIEDAGSLTLAVIDEIAAYMDSLTEPCGIVLVDVIDHFDELAEVRAEFVQRFDIVSDAEEAPEEDDLFEDIDLSLDRQAEQEEAVPAELPAMAVEAAASTGPSAEETAEETVEENTALPEEETAEAEPVAAEQVEEVVQAEEAALSEDVYEDEASYEDDEAYAEYDDEDAYDEEDYDDAYEDMYEDEEAYEEDAYEDELYDEAYEDEEDFEAYDDAYEDEGYEAEDYAEELPADYYDEMDIDDFATYAQAYAKQIDCIMPGKTVLALYERIEIMEEDEIPLTKATAEELVEEAADKAEKPSISKRLTGMFNSKYDKDGHLILREEHFIS